MPKDTTEEMSGLIVAYRATRELVEALDAVARAEGLSRSDVARRAVLRDLKRKEAEHHG